jgi:AcrR family transcriptional regulator
MYSCHNDDMNMARTYSSPLRKRQADDTRQRIVNAALELIKQQPHDSFTHEQIASRAEIALRTVYRYFPSRDELLDAVWQESTAKLRLSSFPNSETSLIEAIDPVFRSLDENAALMRGLLRSNAGQEMRARDNEHRRQGIADALENATRHLEEDARRRVTAVFQTLFSARAWEIMRDRAGLAEGEPAQAAMWAIQTLLSALYRDQKRSMKKGEAKTGSRLQFQNGGKSLPANRHSLTRKPETGNSKTLASTDDLKPDKSITTRRKRNTKR